MTPTVIDNFTPNWNSLRAYADSATYADVVNPVDGVAYPGICRDLPAYVTDDIKARLGSINIKALFMRLSLKGVKAPHQAHTDSTMGNYSLMLYMNREKDSTGGTSLVRHIETGIESDIGLTEARRRIWLRDTNRAEKWSVTKLAWMQPNRAFIFPAHMMHRAEPVGGFGNNSKNGRLVLTAFFD
jgi:hypothetical protein